MRERIEPNSEIWLSVTALADVEQTTRRQVYSQIDLGMPHSKIGSRVRVRRRDWHAWHEKHLKGQVG